MLNRRRFLATATFSSLALPGILRAGLRREDRQGFLPGDGSSEITICAIGDLERASEAGRLLLSQADNDEDREKIIAHVAEEKPDLLLLLGDQTADAGSEVEWRFFDGVTQPLRDAGIRTLAVRGERDYSTLDRKIADQHAHTRWPETRERPHFTTLGSVAIIGLDTNLDMLDDETRRLQQESFVAKLKEYDADPAIRGVIVFGHHPPYTNSALGADQDLIDRFATPFLAASKTKIFLCGHVHSYERFTHADGKKLFVTSGGGSGPRRTVDVSDSRPFTNDVKGLLRYPLRPFNFVRLRIGGDAITGETMMLQKKGFVTGDRFSVALATV